MPVRASLVVAGDALLANVNVALEDPVVCGSKVTVKFALWPAWIVNGNEIPLNEKCELLLLAALMVTFAPAAVSCPEALALAPTATFPKFNVVGVTESWPTAAVPVPVRSATTEDGLALVTKVRVALAAPAVCGLKVTVNGALWPA